MKVLGCEVLEDGLELVVPDPADWVSEKATNAMAKTASTATADAHVDFFSKFTLPHIIAQDDV